MGREIRVFIQHSLMFQDVHSSLSFVSQQEFIKTGAKMRNISDSALQEILTTEGTEPITLVQIFWDEQSSIIYGDRAFLPEIKGQLLELGEIENVVNASAGSNTGSTSMRLNDTDGSLKQIIDTMDIHKRPVYVLQWFPQIPLKDAFVVFDGVISSPIVWKEGERTLSFEIISKIEDLEVGYSAEEGNFEYIPPAIKGQAWPFIFGTVLRVPALMINEVPTGFTQDDTGIDAFGEGQGPLANIKDTESKNISLLMELERQCFTTAAILLGNADSLDAKTVTSPANKAVGLHGGGTVMLSGWIGDNDEKFPTHLSGKLYRRSNNPVAQQMYDLGTQYEERGNEYLKERMRPINTGMFNNPNAPALERNQIRIANGGKFPQKQNIIITINGAPHEGYFEGEIFNIVSRTHPFTNQSAVVGPTEVIDRAVATEYKTDLGVQSFFYAIAGSSVNINVNSYPIYYIIGIPHVTNIVVLAKKDSGGLNKFVVPSSYYTILYKTFEDLKATFLVMHRPLSSRGEGWQDEIWVNCTSPIGPNAVDIMKYIIEHYTNSSWDQASFDSVRVHVNPYKCGFALLDRRNALQVLQEIAYQSRCAIWFKGGRFYLKYLPLQGNTVETFTESDVESGTMEVFCTETEDLVTKWSIDWRPRLDLDPPDKIIYRYHVNKYGLIKEDYDCYIYNNIESVKKFALFWLIRKANTWKKIRFSTFLTKVRVEPFDSVLLNFTYPWVNDPGCVLPTVGVVEQASYDSESQRIQMVIWVPIRFGEMCPYDFAYPASVDITMIFPQENDPGIQTDIPGSLAPGQLYDQSEELLGPDGVPTTTPANSGFGGDTIPSDQKDQQNSNQGFYDPPKGLNAEDMANTGIIDEGANQTTVSQRTIKPINIQATDVGNAAFPGFVRERLEGKMYEVDVYVIGLKGTPQQFNVEQLVLHSDDIIPNGTPCLVLRNVLYGDTGQIENVEYTMQVPIWLNPPSGSTAEPPILPPADPGQSPEPPIEPPPEADEGDQ